MNDISVTARADRNKHLLEDPDFQAAFQAVRDAIHQRFEQTVVGSKKEMKQQLFDLRTQLYLLDSVKRQVEIFIEDGDFARFEEEERERLANQGAA